MDSIFEDFRNAHLNGDGYLLSSTLSPMEFPSQPDRLRSFYRSTSFATVKTDIKYRILYDNSSPVKLPAEEGTAWIEVYCAYWKAVGDILNAEAASTTNAKVNIYICGACLLSIAQR